MSSTLIAIIISVVVALMLLISFFVGRKRGVKRTLLNSGITLAMIILAFFLTPIITNAFMDIAVTVNGTTATVGTYISTLLIKEKGIGPVVENSSSLQSFINGVVPAVSGVLIFVVLCLLFKLIGFAIYKIIEKFALKSKAQEEELGLSRNKLGGGLLSAVKTLLFTVAIFLPFTSLLSFVESNFFDDYAEVNAQASSITDTLDSLPSTKEISNEIPSDVKKIVAGYNNSIIGLCGSVFGLDDVCFDYISQINVKGNNVNLRQTAESLLNFYDYALDLYDDYKEEPTDFFKTLDYDQLDTYKKELLDSGMFKGFVLNVVYDLTQNYDKILEEDLVRDIDPILKDVKNHLASSEKPTDELLNDVYKLFDIFKSAGKSGFLDEINALGENVSAEDILYLTIDKYTNTFVSETVYSVFNIGLVRASFESVIDEFKSTLGSDKTENAIKQITGKITNWEQFIYELNDILTDVGDLYHYVENTGVSVEDFIDDYYLILKANPNTIGPVVTTVGGILDKVNNLELMKNRYDEKILNSVLDSLGMGDLLKGITTTGQTVNYSYAFGKLVNSAKYLLEFNLYEEIKNADYTSAICKIGDAIYTDSLKNHATGELSSQEKLEHIFKTLYELPRFKELTIDEFADDMSTLVDLNVLNDANVRDAELRYMTNIIIELSKNKIETAAGVEMTYLRFLLTDGNDFEGLLKTITDEQVDTLLTPILKSKMTKGICDTIFDTIKTTLIDATGDDTIELVYSNEIFNNADEQTSEVCDIFKKFLTVYNSGEINSLDDIEYADLGLLLDEMKENAYRYELFSKNTAGIFKDSFDSLISTAEEKYDISFTKTMNMTEIYNVNFTVLFDFVQVVEDNPSDFTTNLKKLISNDNTIDKGVTIKEMLDSINSTNYNGVDLILTKAGTCGININVTGIEIDNSGVQMAVEAAIDTYTFSDTLAAEQITNLRTKLKTLLVTGE